MAPVSFRSAIFFRIYFPDRQPDKHAEADNKRASNQFHLDLLYSAVGAVITVRTYLPWKLYASIWLILLISTSYVFHNLNAISYGRKDKVGVPYSL